MNHNKNGFLLINFLIYFTLTLFVSSLVGVWSLRIYQSITAASKKMHEHTQWHLAFDVLSRDVMAMSATQNLLKMDDTCLIWQQGDEAIGWSIEKGMLLRFQGVYDAINHSWKKKTQSLIAQNIQEGTFFVRKKKSIIQTIHVQLTNNYGTIFNKTLYTENGYV